MHKTAKLAAALLASAVCSGAIGCDGASDSAPARSSSDTSPSAAGPLAGIRSALALDGPGAIRRTRARHSAATPLVSDGGTTVTDPTIPARFRAFAAAFDAERQGFGAPGAAVAILEHGEVTFAHGFGTKGSTSTEPVDAKTLFRIGSMTKALTATRFLQLEDEGRVDVHEDLTRIVPNVALSGPDVARLTMNDLMSQQSGLFDFTNFSGNPAVSTVSCSTDPGALQDFVSGTLFSQNEFFAAPPHSLFNYSNTNYILTGAAVERASGVPYIETMQRSVFAPLQMARTFFLPSQVVADGDYANGLSANPDGSPWDIAPADYDCGWFRPAGFAFSSVLDYAKFAQFLYRGDPRVLSDERRREMETGHVDTFEYGDTLWYGYGLGVSSGLSLPSGYYRTELISHSGALPGFATEFYLLPETGFGFVAFANTDGAYFGTSLELALQSFGDLPAASPVPPSTILEPSELPEYAGTYVDPSGNVGEIVVTASNGALTVDLPDIDGLLPYVPTLTPASNNNFILTIEGADAQEIELTFTPAPDGTYQWILIDDGLVAARVAPDAGE